MTEQELNKIILNEIRKFEIDNVKLSTCFEYVYTDNLIHYCLEKDMTDKYFKDFLKDRFDFEYKNDFILSLFHEIGHHQNNDDIDGDVYGFCIGEKYKIQEELYNTEDDDRIKNLNYRYFSLPDEIMATAWAVNYITENYEEVEEIRKRIKKAIKEYKHTNKKAY